MYRIAIFLNKIIPRFTIMVRAKLNTIMSILVLTFILSLSGCAAQVEKAPVKNMDAFIIVDDIDAARADIESSGGRVVHIFPEDKVMIGELPKKFKSKHVDGVFYEGSKAKPSKGLVFYNAWTKNLEYKKLSYAQKMAMVPSDTEPIYNDLIDPALFPGMGQVDKSKLVAPSSAADFSSEDVSSYFVGDVSVNIVFPEGVSGGEDWSNIDTVNGISDRRAYVVQEIMNGMDWWAQKESNAHLTFVYHNETVSIPEDPIEQNYNGMWMFLTSGQLDPPNSGWTAVYNYANEARNTDNTDWSFVFYVVDSLNDADGMFADEEYFAFTLDGLAPGQHVLSIMTYDNQVRTIFNMDGVAAHETGHIFGAKDQYDPDGDDPLVCSCTLKGGYLDVENGNCENGCTINEHSIMKYDTIAYPIGALDDYAKGQVGWSDDNSNGILDVVDGAMYNDIYNHTQKPEESGSILNYEGEGIIEVVTPINTNYNPVLINNIQKVKWSADLLGFPDENLPWSDATGTFNLPSVNYLFNIDTINLPWGAWTFKTKSITRFGDEGDIAIDELEIYGCEGGNLDPKIYGNVSNYDGTYNFAEDTCSTNDGRFPVVVQYSCEGYNIVSTESPCFYGCRDGKCMKKFIPRKYYMMEAVNCEEGRDGRFCDGMLYGG
jgi:hypothetical protein